MRSGLPDSPQASSPVRSGEAEVGLIIHEAQLTYSKGGFHNVIDLGRWWKNLYNLPLPLGANALRRETPSLTAVIEAELDRRRTEVGFALEMMEESRIQVATTGEMPEIAERARVELKA